MPRPLALCLVVFALLSVFASPFMIHSYYRSVKNIQFIRPVARLSNSRCFSSGNDNNNNNNNNNDKRANESPVGYDYHIPVMRDECMTYLDIKPDGVYIDCTMGGGGHTRAILERGGRVIGLDQDPDAVKATSALLDSYIREGRLEIQQVNFRHIRAALQRSKLANGRLADGVLMDLGISSYQINEATRGFAFAADGPLDMRMHQGTLAHGDGSLTAAEIVNQWKTEDIANLLYNYGDETRSRVIAREIVAARPLNTTGELERLISRFVSFKDRPKTLARCFQALRIAVNDEIGALEQALTDVKDMVRPGGRLVIISYHSLEDRRSKKLIRTGSVAGVSDKDDDNDNDEQDKPTAGDHNPWRAVFRRALKPTNEEIERNSRSRSARLRVAERVDADMLAAELKAKTPTMGAKQLRKMQQKLQQ